MERKRLKMYELEKDNLYKVAFNQELIFNYPIRQTKYFYLIDIVVNYFTNSICLEFLTHEGIFKDGWGRCTDYEFEEIEE